MRLFVAALLKGFFAAALAALLTHPLAAAASTVAVGSCRPHWTSYATISEAVAAATAGSTVLVCPGTYPEQVTITIPLTLQGVSPITTSPAVITVPSGGVTLPQILIEGTDFGPLLDVTIENIVVDGTGSTGGTGIAYIYASGRVSLSEVRNVTTGIGAAVDLATNTVDVQKTYIHNFDGTGVSGFSNGGTLLYVNVRESLLQSNKPNVTAVDYFFANGIAAKNFVILQGGTGLLLENFFPTVTAQENIIQGAEMGIAISRDIAGATIVRNNVLTNNATGIFLIDGASAEITSNAIVQSSVQAIAGECTDNSTLENNFIYGAPIGISNITPDDVRSGNTFVKVKTDATQCE